MIAIIDYGAGNLRSVANLITKLGYQPKVTSNPKDVLDATAVILPGVGAAAESLVNLRETGMAQVIDYLVSRGKRLLRSNIVKSRIILFILLHPLWSQVGRIIYHPYPEGN